MTTTREVFYGATSLVASFLLVMKCCCFGHRDVIVTQELHEKTKACIYKFIDEGCKTFLFGGFGDFDRLCYRIVTQLKNELDDSIQRIFCVPQERYLRKSAHFFNRDDYDETIYLMPRFEGWYKSIYYRNLAMIDECDFILFYAEERENSGAYKAFKYARKLSQKTVINLAP